MISKLNGQSSSEMISQKSIFARHGYFKKLYPTIDPHIRPLNTSNLQPNMVSSTRQAAHTQGHLQDVGGSGHLQEMRPLTKHVGIIV